jgi:hypothetical protein
MTVYPETAGKNGNLGSLDEILTMCSRLPRCRPCVDFAHLRAFDAGGWTRPVDYVATLELIKKRLGRTALGETHFHISPIEFGPHGEQRHLDYGTMTAPKNKSGDHAKPTPCPPVPEHLAEALFRMRLACWAVSECRDTQEQGALGMKQRYQKLLAKNT